MEVGDYSCFDISGNGFSGFALPTVIPESTAGILAMTGILRLLSKRRRA